NIKLTASGLVKDWIFRQGAKEAPQASGLLETFVENRLVDCHNYNGWKWGDLAHEYRAGTVW
ncbi:MAG: hypothetical protein SVY53_02115, partial [Chloroflexota bacterium]|nr:hypothetical protein [Chloroflexota bacterium]